MLPSLIWISVSGFLQDLQRTNLEMKPSKESCSLEASCAPLMIHRSSFGLVLVWAPSSNPKYLMTYAGGRARDAETLGRLATTVLEMTRQL